MTVIPRRDVLLTSAAATAGLAASFCSRRPGVSAEEALAAERVAALARACGLSALGSCRRGPFPSRLNVREILEELFPGQNPKSVSELPEAQLENCLKGAIVADFANGRLVSVGGWFLARTEARLCELATL